MLTPQKNNALTYSTLGLFVIAILVVCYAAAAVLIPIISGILFFFMLRPIIERLNRFGIPRGLGAGIMLVLLLGMFFYMVVRISSPSKWSTEVLPSYIEQAEIKLRGLMESVEAIDETSEAIEGLTKKNEDAVEEVDVRQDTFSDKLLSHTQRFIAGWLVVLFLSFFLLASGDMFLRKAVCMMPQFNQRRALVRIFRDIESKVSQYLLSITVINLVLGVSISATFYFLDMPSPILWGIMAAVLNYIPYIGALLGTIAILLFSIVTYETLPMALAPPLLYLALTGLEGMLLRPMILGRWLTLNPVAIFISFVFWGWMWGIVGALLAIPMLMTLKITCDHISSLKPLGLMIGN